MKAFKLVVLTLFILCMDSVVRFFVLVLQKNSYYLGYLESVPRFLHEYLSFTLFYLFNTNLLYLILIGIYSAVVERVPRKRIMYVALGSAMALLMYIAYANHFYVEFIEKQFYPLLLSYPLLGGIFGYFYFNIFQKGKES